MIKIAVKLIKCGCWKVRFARSGLLFFTRKDTKEKRDKYNILPECYSL
jgi:hypothetical protein